MAKLIYEQGFMWLFYHARHQVFANTQKLQIQSFGNASNYMINFGYTPAYKTWF
jgi:hypothetical protein